jgi:hypothetical protein
MLLELISILAIIHILFQLTIIMYLDLRLLEIILTQLQFHLDLQVVAELEQMQRPHPVLLAQPPLPDGAIAHQ